MLHVTKWPIELWTLEWEMETDEDHATMRESSSLVQNLLFTEYTDIFPAWCVGKYGWKTLESRCILIWFFGRNFWCPWHCKRCERTSFGTQYITVLLLNKVSHRPLKKWQGPCNCYSKHCQRHNGPEGWFLLTKVTSPYTNLDQIPKFKISTKTSAFWPNIKISLELQLQTLD